MKKTLCLMLPLLAAPILLGTASCSDDNKEDEPLPSLTSGTVYSGNTLKLEYEDDLMAGKSAKLIQKEEGYILELFSSITPGELSTDLNALPTFSGPGVLPGSPIVSIPVSLKVDGDEYEFEGRSATDYCTFEYSGDIKNGIMDLEIDDVVLKDLSVANTAWKPAPLTPADGGLTYSSSPIYINWECNLPIEIEGIKADPGEILNIIATMPLIPVYNGTAKTSLAELLSESLQSIGFKKNGLVAVNYIKTTMDTDRYASLPQNMIQYVVLGNNMMRIYPNPIDVYSQWLVSNSTRTVTLDGLISLMKDVFPMLSEGIPVQYEKYNSGMRIYLNNQTLKPLLTSVLVPILTDPDIIDSINKTIEADTNLSKFSEAIKLVIASLPEMLENTTTIEMGLNLVPYN